jgi:hypothetical protein
MDFAANIVIAMAASIFVLGLAIIVIASKALSRLYPIQSRFKASPRSLI